MKKDVFKPRVAVTMGDPAGVGPELCLRVLLDRDLARECAPLVVGDAAVLRRVADAVGLPFSAPVVSAARWPAAGRDLAEPAVLDLARLAGQPFEPGRVQAACGAAAHAYFTWAIDAALAGEVHAIATAPLHKEALRAAGVPHPGHTEILAERFPGQRVCMMLTSAEITCGLVTTHVGLAEAPGLLTIDRVFDAIELTAAAMRALRGREPRVAVCGLNPHAGEHGLFGRGEEEQIIAPAIARARHAGLDVVGPLPPDTAFIPARRREIDAHVCMYHDQGLIPLKALAFDTAVNVTLGLPITRASVDHGTAFDIAWRGLANPQSLFEATRLAARLCSVEPGRRP